MNAPVKIPTQVESINAAISKLGGHSQLAVLRHLYREFSMFDCAAGIDIAADEIEHELLIENAVVSGAYPNEVAAMRAGGGL